MTAQDPQDAAQAQAKGQGWQNVASLLEDRIRAAIEQALTDRHDELTAIAQAGGHAAADGLTGGVGSLAGIIKDVALVAIGAAFGPLDALAIASSVEDAAGSLGTGYGLGYLLGSIGFQALQPWLLPLFQTSSRLSQFQTIDAGTAASMYARHIIGQGFFYGEGEKAGFSDNRLDLLAEAAHHYPGLNEVLELRRRGLIQPGDAHQALQRAGVPDLFVPQLLALEQVLLSPADLALAVLRGIITQDDAYSYAARLGVERGDVDTLIGNTGEPPGLEEMLLAYRIGYVDDAQLEQAIRYSRVRSQYIPLIKQLRYRPPATADAIRGAVQNFLPKDQAKTFAQQNGLDPVNFEWMYQTAGDPIAKGEALELWRRGVLDQDHVVQALREGRLKDKWIPAVLELKRELIPIRQLLMIVMHGLKPPEWAIDIMVQRGYDPEDAHALVAIETDGKAAVHKELAQGMVVEMYEARGIDRDTAVKDLQQLGWTEEQAAFILDLQDAKVALSEQRKTITAIRKAFLASRVDHGTARHQLADIGVLDAQAEVLLKDWDIELEGRVVQLTAGDIADSAKYGGLTPDQAHEALVDLGYTDNGAWVYLTAHEVSLPKGVTIHGPIS